MHVTSDLTFIWLHADNLLTLKAFVKELSYVVVPPPSPLPGKYVSAHYTPVCAGAKAFFDRPEIFEILEHVKKPAQKYLNI